jgi:S1-C subfamily serine protease
MLTRLLSLPLAAIALVACTTNQAHRLDDRVINVETGAVPASVALSSSLAGLVADANPSYVTLIISEQARGGRKDDKRSSAVTAGSGFLIDPSGYVLTAGHVAMEKGFTVSAKGPDGRIYSGNVVDVKPSHDMALIRLKGYTGTAVQPSDTACLRKGAAIFTLGKPHAQGDTARFGQVEAMSFGRAVAYQGFGYPDAMVLRMDTKKGESGGPVFNDRGELVGMVVSTLSDGNGRPLNLAHAVALPALAEFICSEMTCTATWEALAKQAAQSCPEA